MTTEDTTEAITEDEGRKVPLDPQLLDLLACPSDDHAPLREETREGAQVLVCSFCASAYRIEDGIPVLLLDEATPGPNGVGVAAP